MFGNTFSKKNKDAKEAVVEDKNFKNNIEVSYLNDAVCGLERCQNRPASISSAIEVSNVSTKKIVVIKKKIGPTIAHPLFSLVSIL